MVAWDGSGPVLSAPAGSRAGRKAGNAYEWALGQRPAGIPSQTSHQQVQSAQQDPDLHKLSKLIRGEPITE